MADIGPLAPARLCVTFSRSATHNRAPDAGPPALSSFAILVLRLPTCELVVHPLHQEPGREAPVLLRSWD